MEALAKKSFQKRLLTPLWEAQQQALITRTSNEKVEQFILSSFFVIDCVGMRL
jgi:hypothetical protein